MKKFHRLHQARQAAFFDRLLSQVHGPNDTEIYTKEEKSFLNMRYAEGPLHAIALRAKRFTPGLKAAIA